MHAPNRILLLAESANPEWASVPLIGWNLSQAISKQVETHIVTQVRNRPAFLRAGLVEGHHFTAIDNESVASPLWRLADLLRGAPGKGWTMSTAFSSLAYYAFERLVWQRFGSRLTSGEFDLVHRVTPVSPTSQSPIGAHLARLGIPFVIGPLNGGVPWPRCFKHRQKAENEWLSDLRWLYRLMPFYRSTRKSAAAIFCGSLHTLREMPAWAARKCIYLPENGVDLARFPVHRRSQRNPLHAAFIGRLVPYKGVDMLLRAASEVLKANQLHLHIIGDGPQMSQLRDLAQELEIDSSVTFHGWIPQGDIQKILGDCDFTVLPSIREFGGGVVIESLAMGLPAIVADYAGPAELIDSSRGIRVPFTSECSLVNGLRAAIERCAKNPTQLEHLGSAGRAFVEANLTWDAKAQQIVKVYGAILNGASDLSKLYIFPMPKRSAVVERNRRD
jgi:glycosyltransferase involved in cell wall biosynthesis